jgi:predicted O-methyltransferase YrrM
MTLGRFLYCAQRPVYTIRLLSFKLHELTHRRQPWITQEAVRFCEANLKRDEIALEWGSGRSTVWFSERVGRLLSIESDSGWHGKVVEKIKRKHNVECRLIPLEHLPNQHIQDGGPLPAYAAVAGEFSDNSLDFVVVDGHYRLECIKEVLPKIKSGGLLLVDNTDWTCVSDWGVPRTWPIVHQSRNLMQETTIWRKPERLDRSMSSLREAS